MASKKMTSKQAKFNLKIGEIVYYSIGGLVLLTSLVFSILGMVILNSYNTTPNGTHNRLIKAEEAFFAWLKWDVDFQRAGLILLVIAIVYFIAVFYYFCKKGDEVDKKAALAKTRQRQVVFQAKVETSEVSPSNPTEN